MNQAPELIEIDLINPNPYQVRQQACHSDTRTTMTYLRARRDDLRLAVERM